MYYFSSLFSSSSTTSQFSTAEHQRILTRLKRRGEEACQDQYALLLSWLNPSHTLSNDPALIPALAECMKDPASFRNHQIACTLVISKLDPNDGHAKRIKSVLNALHTSPIESLPLPLFKLFHLELSAPQLKAIYLKACNACDALDTQQIQYALPLLGTLFSCVDEPEQSNIITKIASFMAHSQEDLRKISAEVLGNLKNTNDSHRDSILEELAKHRDDTDVNVRMEIARSYGALFPQALEPEQEEMINLCIKDLKNTENNYLLRQTSARALGAMLIHADEAQQESIKEVIRDHLFDSQLLVGHAAIHISAAFFKSETPTNQSLIAKAHLSYLEHSSVGLQQTAAQGLIAIYSHAESTQQALILHELNTLKDKGNQPAKKVHTALTSAEPTETQSNVASISDNTSFASLPTLSHEQLKFIYNPHKDRTVREHVISFCCQTFLDVKTKNETGNNKTHKLVTS